MASRVTDVETHLAEPAFSLSLSALPVLSEYLLQCLVLPLLGGYWFSSVLPEVLAVEILVLVHGRSN